jgi:DnaJ-domain-containing protein 1
MGQIFNRAFRVAKSYINDEPAGFNYNTLSDDDELKRIIDELNNVSKKTNSNSSNQQKKESNTNTNQTVNSLENAFKVLEISPNASNNEIKSAYKKKIKEYHPDRLETFGEELKKLAQVKTQEINKAYNLIREKRGF